MPHRARAGVSTITLGLCLTVASGLLGPAPASGEVIKKVSVGTILDSNAYGSYEEEADLIGRLHLYLANRRTGQTGQLEYYLSGAGNLFRKAGDRTFSLSSAGLSYAKRVGDGRNTVYAGANVSVRLDRSYYDIYDYVSTQGMLEVKWYARPDLMLRGGYRIRALNYWNLDLFSNVEHQFTAEVARFLPSKTTLKADLTFGYKDNRDAVTETVQLGSFGRRRMQTASVVVEPGVSNEAQLTLGLQLAQSLASGTGLSFRYETRTNPVSGGTYLTGEETTYGGEDDLFNDRYDYEGHEWTFRLTQQLPGRARLVASAGYEIRDFEGREPLDLEGNPMDMAGIRKDRSVFGDLSLEKPLTDTLSLGLWYGLDRNKSNDPYYYYGLRHSLSMDLKLSF